MVYTLVYVSSATRQFGKDELEALLTKAREKNHTLGITGILLYKDGNFMQALEGEKEQVLALYEEIDKDPRHKGTLVLLREEIEAREFPDWSMGFRDLEIDDNTRKPGYNEFLNTALTDNFFATNPNKAHKLLRMFKKGM